MADEYPFINGQVADATSVNAALRHFGYLTTYNTRELMLGDFTEAEDCIENFRQDVLGTLIDTPDDYNASQTSVPMRFGSAKVWNPWANNAGFYGMAATPAHDMCNDSVINPAKWTVTVASGTPVYGESGTNNDGNIYMDCYKPFGAPVEDMKVESVLTGWENFDKFTFSGYVTRSEAGLTGQSWSQIYVGNLVLMTAPGAIWNATVSETVVYEDLDPNYLVHKYKNDGSYSSLSGAKTAIGTSAKLWARAWQSHDSYQHAWCRLYAQGYINGSAGSEVHYGPTGSAGMTVDEIFVDGLYATASGASDPLLEVSADGGSNWETGEFGEFIPTPNTGTSPTFRVTLYHTGSDFTYYNKYFMLWRANPV